jgi:hypothetical protein
MHNLNAQIESKLADYLKAIESIESSYVEVANLIEPEHRAIAEANLTEIERITPIKVLAGEKFECAVNAFNKAWRSNESCRDEKGSISLGSVLLYLTGLVQQVADESLTSKLQLCAGALQRLVKLREKTEPRIKMNKYLLERMLRFQQENYLFWQEVLAESEATYGKQGSRNVTQRQSILTVKV